MRARMHTPEIQLPSLVRIVREIERGTPPAIIGWREPPPIVQRCAAPTWQATGTGVGKFGDGTMSPSWPAHAADDVAILFVTVNGSSDPGAATLDTAAGFTAVTGGSDLTTNGVSIYTRATTFWCRATSGAMSAPTVADAAGGSTTASAIIITFRGCTTSGDPTDGASVAANATGNTALVAAGVTTTGADRAVFIGFGIPASGSTGSYSNSNLTSITERHDANIAGGNHVTIATATAASAGDFGNTTATHSASSWWAAVTVALKPPDTANPSNLLLLGVG